MTQLSIKQKEKLAEVIWVAKELFERGKTSGSTANISCRIDDVIFISGTNTCFGRLSENDFAQMSLSGEHLAGVKPSKEFPLHLALYAQDSTNQAVIHTHSHYATLWSCLHLENKDNVFPNYTPYLDMKVGPVKLVDYYPPGSEALFAAFRARMDVAHRGYLLKNHGPVVADQSILKAFYAIEELEESAHIAWELAYTHLEKDTI